MGLFRKLADMARESNDRALDRSGDRIHKREQRRKEEIKRENSVVCCKNCTHYNPSGLVFNADCSIKNIDYSIFDCEKYACKEFFNRHSF